MGVELRLCNRGRQMTRAILCIARAQNHAWLHKFRWRGKALNINGCPWALPPEFDFAHIKYFPIGQFSMLTGIRIF